MLIQISGKGIELNTRLREAVTEKLGMALHRFSSRIRRIHVFFEDLNGPKSGCDKVLRVSVDCDRLPQLTVTERGEDWHSILDKLATRTAHSMSRKVDRVRSVTDRTSMAGDEKASFGSEE